ncbi:alpha-amylase family glycosyl hydrolase [Chitinophagaceae bacterium LB-8]|uniref:Alpha-amylase n=1 Tax=Paraflavisolibacter caeni TaxID=2982496 RepID=A0A9X2Y1T2_9BACT|nr:alpha-amylase family glycosyl hydrolase [Paraflavisolibacter caeni]MCU7551838.1 alpha-amylase family glycosyl hydrolase [Paraflavisolibacter caeni]
MVDRFHDSHSRQTAEFEVRHHGFGSGEQLTKLCGGTLRGITQHLDYINQLGCTAIWLSPVFKNNPESYHGYAIENYLEVDERFGTKADLEELVDKAHSYDMRVFLDIVLHHSGNNWGYAEGKEYFYNGGLEFPFGQWRYPDKPVVPIELRNPALYSRKGQIKNFDAYPETREGDFFTLKAFRSDESWEAIYVQQILTAIHCYWIRETDVDGFRLDAVKHMGALAISRFCSNIREYAYSLGKRNFFLFGEVVGADDVCNLYVGPKTLVTYNDQNIYYGLNSVLDFQLYFLLEGVIKGKDSPGRLIDRYVQLQKNAIERGEYGEFLITFIDNHDQIGFDFKKRFGNNAAPEQIIAGIAFLLCALGTPCIYYGTEQGFDGCGENDSAIRECMFNLEDKNTNLLNTQSAIYQAIAAIARFRNESNVLRFGRMFVRELSNDGIHFHLPNCHKCTLAFSRVLFDQEVVFIYNSSNSEAKEECILIDGQLNKTRNLMKTVYGNKCHVPIHHCDQPGIEISYIKLHLDPIELVILKNF